MPQGCDKVCDKQPSVIDTAMLMPAASAHMPHVNLHRGTVPLATGTGKHHHPRVSFNVYTYTRGLYYFVPGIGRPAI